MENQNNTPGMPDDMVDVTDIPSKFQTPLGNLIRMIGDATITRNFSEGMMNFPDLCHLTSSIASVYVMGDQLGPALESMGVSKELIDSFDSLIHPEQVKVDMELHACLTNIIHNHLNKVRTQVIDKFI